MTLPAETSSERSTGPARLALIVCTANICRSPMAEFLIGHHVRTNQGDTPWVFASAGTDARPGKPMCTLSARAITHLPGGAEFAAQHRAVRLTPELVDRASLILTASVRERAIVARMAADRRNRLFTLLEAARLADLPEPAVSRDGFLRTLELSDRLHRSRGLAGESSQPQRRGLLRRSGRPAMDIADVHTGEARNHRAAHETLTRVSRELREAFLAHSAG